MKKFLFAFTATVLLTAIIMTGCGSKDADTEKTQPSTALTTTAEPATEKPTKPATEKVTETKKTQPTTKAAETTKATQATKAATPVDNKNNIVVVLDAGHDSTVHTRTHPNLGVNEQDLNFKITNYACKRLRQYNGVTVYRSRPTGECPIQRLGWSYVNDYPEPCIRARTDYAEKKKADIFISFHCNASTGNLGASANGAEVYVSKHPKYYSKTKKLGELVLRNIASRVDISTRGVLTRSKPEKGNYPDGTVKDFYYLLSNNIDNGRPAMIIEHAYMDNSHDNAILKDDKNLKRFGIADADAIAEYYGLTLK